MKEIPLYSGCFVCGQENETGLKARFFWDEDKAVCDITANEAFSGYKNVFHGGIVATLLDEVMIKSLLAQGILAVTAELTVQFLKPANCGDKLHLEGWKSGGKGSVYLTEGQAVNQDGDTVARATAKYVKPKSGLGDRLRESL
ncbi:MAG: PaaI family thioesterase [candidate division Zixibacteria bacterium]|nr:PaaI family thioesterase [candidate division Zixibacteria bacterium]